MQLLQLLWQRLEGGTSGWNRRMVVSFSASNFILMPSISVSYLVSVLQRNRVYSPIFSRAFEALFAQSAASAILNCMISNVNNFGSDQPTVLKFGEHPRVSVCYTPTKFNANQITRFQSSKSESASRPCIFDPLCSTTSDRHISASHGPILLGFGQEVPSDVL